MYTQAHEGYYPKYYTQSQLSYTPTSYTQPHDGYTVKSYPPPQGYPPKDVYVERVYIQPQPVYPAPPSGQPHDGYSPKPYYPRIPEDYPTRLLPHDGYTKPVSYVPAGPYPQEVYPAPPAAEPYTLRYHDGYIEKSPRREYVQVANDGERKPHTGYPEVAASAPAPVPAQPEQNETKRRRTPVVRIVRHRVQKNRRDDEEEVEDNIASPSQVIPVQVSAPQTSPSQPAVAAKLTSEPIPPTTRVSLGKY